MVNPVVSVDKSGKIPVYIVKKILSDEQTEALKAKFLNDSHFKVVLKDDADVYTEDGKLLLRFRKGVLPSNCIDAAYESMKDFIKNKTSDRGVASGSKPGLETGQKIPVMSNIMGYFDKWAVGQKSTFKRTGVRPPGPCRLCRFNAQFPEKWRRVIPLIKQIDEQYAKLCPNEYADQRRAAKKTAFHISGTSFSTVTTNLNFRTASHTDSGDWPTGFGNLVVIERGAPYKGNFTGFPQYGVAVDCRTGDFLAMDVHQVHGNTEMEPKDETSQRLSLVCYLREGIINKCNGQKLYDPVALDKKLKRFTQKKKRD